MWPSERLVVEMRSGERVFLYTRASVCPRMCVTAGDNPSGDMRALWTTLTCGHLDVHG